MQRSHIAGLSLSATALVALLSFEGYRGQAYVPVAGDVPTIGFGTTEGVRAGQTIDPVTALNRAVRDVTKFEGTLKQCVRVPLTQNEYDAYVQLAYNIGPAKFCKSTLVRKLNMQDYVGACTEIPRWNYFKGKVLPGLNVPRKAQYELCMKGQNV